MTPRAAIGSLSPTLLGAALMVIAAGFAVGMHTTVRILSSDLHVFQIVFLRQAFALLVLMPWFFRVGFGALRTERLSLHLSRGGIMLCANILWFAAIALVPLAKVSALGYTQALFAVLGAVLFLGEKPHLRRWVALGVGFAGLVVIVRPGFETLSLGVILVLASRIFVAANKVMTKSLSSTESSATIVAYGAAYVSVGSFLPALTVWHSLSPQLLGLALVMGGLGALGQLCMVQAYKLADLGAMEPLSFTRLLWAGLFGFLFFGEIPTVWTWIGAAMIIAAVSYLARSEMRAEKRGVRAESAPAE